MDSNSNSKSFERSSFIFTTCQLRAEDTLKKEIRRTHPELKFAFSQPGFLTFKSEEPMGLDFVLDSTFARSYGLSFSKLNYEQLAPLDELVEELSKKFPRRLPALHIWERDFYVSGEAPVGFVAGELAHELEEKVRNRHPSRFLSPTTRTLDRGTPVIDLVILKENDFWLGAHVHSSHHSVFPGSNTEIPLPSDAPSRAYLKLEESLIWSKAPLLAGDMAIEIGSAPGGASYSLLKRGVKVVGIDPGQMDPVVLNHPAFVHIAEPVNSVLRERLPDLVHWILLDMNVEPRISLYAVDRLVHRTKETLLGVFLTVKLNQWRMADEIPAILEHVRAMGMKRVKAAQLSHHRQEIVIYGVTRKGMLRDQQKEKKK